MSEQTRENGITVTGTGRAADVPDVFVVAVAASASADSPAEALQQAGDALVAMREAALAHGVPPRQLTTRDMVIHQDFDHQGQPRGYVAELALTVRLTGAGRPGELVSACVEAGGSAARLQSTSFEHSDPTALLAQAREAAFEDARSRARQLAGLAGRELGAVESVLEGAVAWAPARESRMLAMSASAPVDAGSLDASATVTVTWSWA